MGGFVLDDSPDRHVRRSSAAQRRMGTGQRDVEQRGLDDPVDQPNVYDDVDVTDRATAAAVGCQGQLQHQLAQTRISGRARRFHAVHFHADLCHSTDLHLRFLLPRPVETAGMQLNSLLINIYILINT